MNGNYCKRDELAALNELNPISERHLALKRGLIRAHNIFKFL